MHQDYTKICRVCMSDGSRDIFNKPSLAASADGSTASAAKTVSPLERLLEKLRYVTMMKIEENDDLPRLLCDLCIVQLNVAYNFKRQAVENDTKLRQYFIENGITSNQAIIINEAPSLRSSFTASNISQQQPHQRFPIVPLIVKTEPSDMDAFSDATTETNVEIDRNRFQSVASNTTHSSPEEVARCTTNSRYSNERNQSSMVYVNSSYEFNSVTPSSDIEFVQNYQLNTNREHSNNGQRQPSNASKTSGNDPNKQTSSANHILDSPVARENSRVRSASKESSSASKAAARRLTKREREICNLSIDMVPSTVITNLPKEHRRKLGKTTRVPPEGEKDSPIQKLNVVTSSTPTTPSVTKSPNSTKRSASSPITLSPSPVSEKKSNTDNSQAKSTSSPHRLIDAAKRRINPEKMIVLNPFNTSKNANRLKTARRTDANSKRKSQQKLLRPKIEPPLNRKN